MKQVVQSTGRGNLSVIEVPAPQVGPTDILVQTRRSLVSSGTERALRELAKSSLLRKAQARPDLVKQVLNRVREEGLRATVKSVKSRLDDVTPLGYSAAGIVLESGEYAPHLRPGTRVATASVGHAGLQVVPGLLAVPVPDSVTDEEAAFAAVAAIAMHGLHQARPMIGDTVIVAGLGLVGQLTARLAVAAGLKVIGVDLNPVAVALAEAHGAIGVLESGDETTAQISALCEGRDPDAVIITASTPSSEPVMRACERVRDRGSVVVVGDIGLELDRTPFYLKEVELRFARSYGPGRYDSRFEQLALDYPAGYVPRTQRTNIAAYLDLIDRDRLQVSDLVSRTYDINDAATAYEDLASNREILAIQFSYQAAEASGRNIHLAPTTVGDGRVALVGAGNFVGSVLMPAMQKSGWGDIAVVAGAGGLSAQRLAARFAVPDVTTDASAAISRDDVATVFVATRHDSHSDLISKSLAAGKHVFCEKPVAIDEAGLDEVASALHNSDRVLWLGFNRRHSEAIDRAIATFDGQQGPLTLHYRVSAGSVPDGHWLKDPRQGGRLLGEVCHFVDTASWVVGEQPESVTALGRARGPAILQDDVSLLLSYPGGSTVTIDYITGGSSNTPKERIEILGRGHTVVIDDFKTVSVDGRPVQLEAPGKGHVANLAAFRRAVDSGERDVRGLETSLASTSTMLAAVRSLTSGSVERVHPVSIN